MAFHGGGGGTEHAMSPFAPSQPSCKYHELQPGCGSYWPALWSAGFSRPHASTITEHSCFNSEFGPFETMMANAGSAVSAATPNIDPVHTGYRIGLAGEYSVVTPKAKRCLGGFVEKTRRSKVLAGQAEALPSSWARAHLDPELANAQPFRGAPWRG
jgi:hypothetical protein